MTSYLVVAHQTGISPELVQEVRSLVKADSSCELTILVPATPVNYLRSESGLTAMEIATKRAEESRVMLEAIGAKVTRKSVGDPDPLKAIENELNQRNDPYTGLIICTLPEGISRWLKRDLPNQAKRKFSLPVTHVVAGDRGLPLHDIE